LNITELPCRVVYAVPDSSALDGSSPFRTWCLRISPRSARARRVSRLSSPRAVTAASKAASVGANRVNFSVPPISKSPRSSAASSPRTREENPLSTAVPATFFVGGTRTSSMTWITPLPALLFGEDDVAPFTTRSWVSVCTRATVVPVMVAAGPVTVSPAVTTPSTMWYNRIAASASWSPLTPSRVVPASVK